MKQTATTKTVATGNICPCCGQKITKIIFSEDQSQMILESYNNRSMDKFELGLKMDCSPNTIIQHLQELEIKGNNVLWSTPLGFKNSKKVKPENNAFARDPEYAKECGRKGGSVKKKKDS